MKKESFEEKIISTLNALDYKLIYKNAIGTILLIFALYVFLQLMYTAYLYSVYSLYADDHIEAYLNKTSENILLKSSNRSEIIQNIVEWEQKEFISKSKTFNGIFQLPYRIPQNAGWYIFLNRGNCGERARVFNDMASRTGLTYRKIVVDGFIDRDDNSSSDHSWSEVLLEDGSWVIVDAGFGIYPPYNNKSAFHSKWNLMLGPVFVYENITCTIDCTEYYVDKTERLTVKAVRNGRGIDDSSVHIKFHYNDASKEVAGSQLRFIKYTTNESGLCPITLGVYDNTSYTLKLVDSRGVYQYEGEENIVLGNNTGEVEIEVNKLRPNTASYVLMLLILLNIVIWKPLVKKRTPKKPKRQKL